MSPEIGTHRFRLADDEDHLLPANPFYGLRYHFGMLLGQDDLETEQGYHRGKHRLHGAWFHGEGVVWGMAVRARLEEDQLQGEIQVEPGLAIDAAGNDLRLHRPSCVNVGRWLGREIAEDRFTPVAEAQPDGSVLVRSTLHVVARFNACLSRPVPAIAEPCEGQFGDTEYSRSSETVDLFLRADPAPPRARSFPRLRTLFGLVESAPPESGGEDEAIAPEDVTAEVAEALDSVSMQPAGARLPALLRQFRVLAARDAAEHGPAGSLQDAPSLHFPRDGRPELVLAELRVVLRQPESGAGWTLENVDVDMGVRDSHVPTSTLQELLCGALLGLTGSPLPTEPALAPEEEGPRIDPSSIQVDDRTVTFQTTRPLSKHSVTERGIEVWDFDQQNDGWVRHQLDALEHDDGKVTITLKQAPGGHLHRLIVRGTGAEPVLGTNLVPLAGAVGGPRASIHLGNDFFHVWR